jgi:hypothetical protein
VADFGQPCRGSQASQPATDDDHRVGHQPVG